MELQFHRFLKTALGTLAALGILALPSFANDDGSILNKLKKISVLGSTVPGNGDVNPYGIVRVSNSVGNLHEGHYLISNFNASSNHQGTGTTIVEVSPSGDLTLFSQIDPLKLPGPCPGGVGLTTALAVLQTGWVIVGSLPTSDGSPATAKAGCLIVLNAWGKPVETFYGSLINGPWDMAFLDGTEQAVLFVTNVLNGTVAANGKIVNQGTVLRVNLSVSPSSMPYLESVTVIGNGYPERTDTNALVIGPTGLGMAPPCQQGDGDCSFPFGGDEPVLYVADSLGNRIRVITDPLTRSTSSGLGKILSIGGSLNDPLGLTVAPDGHILVVNGNDGFVIEITPQGAQIAKKLIDSSGSPAGAGALFGLIFDSEVGLVYVDDASNTLNALQ